MKLSKDTLGKLKHFAEINSNILLSSGNKLKTVNTTKSLLGETTIEDQLEVGDGFGIYDLNEFLGVISLFEDPDLTFSEKFVTISKGNSNIKYFAANKEVLVYPSKDIVFPEPTISFDLSGEVINSTRRAASVLNVSFIHLNGDGTNIRVNVGEVNNATSTSYSTVIGTTDKTFNAIIKVEHFKLIPADYRVDLALMGEGSNRKCISRFTSKDNVFFIAVESSSTFAF